MPTSVPGSSLPRRAGRGFTMIELLVVVALIAIASAVTTLALRDPAAARLEREAARLAALLEAARSEARAAGLPARWVPGGAAAGFRFVGLPAALALPSAWLDEAVRAEVQTEQGTASAAVLGPEPVIGAQRIVLRLDTQSLVLATDGLGPFAVAPPLASPAP
jgi:general secretion pathway protein H